MVASASPSSPIRPLGAAPLLDGFRLLDVPLDTGVTIRAAVDGNGPPLLLLHGVIAQQDQIGRSALA
jgi:hypothetical protein